MISLNSVDLPAPLRPINAMRSLGSSASEAPRRIGSSPMAKETSMIWTSDMAARSIRPNE